MSKETPYDVYKQTQLIYYKLGSAKFRCKDYTILYNGKLKRWTCTCKGFVRSGGKNVCKHISASVVKIYGEIKEGGIKNETGNAELQANQSD